jgi:hypothetical protein
MPAPSGQNASTLGVVGKRGSHHKSCSQLVPGSAGQALGLFKVRRWDALRWPLARRLDGCGRDELVFCGPGGSNGVPRGARSRLPVGNYRRVYRLAVARAELPSWTRMAPRPAPHLRDDDFGRGEHAGWLHPFWSQIGPPGCMERSGVLVMEVHMDQKRVHALVREERDRLERLRWLVEDDETTFDESARPGDA